MIIIDGSAGEGGGQILRSSLSMSLLTGKPFRMENIRAGRKNPGLMRQHLTAVNAAAEVADAGVSGNSIGSSLLEFTPGPVKPGKYSCSIGSAGSCTLVLQTILPALLTAGDKSEITLEGGTHNPFAPPFDFLEKAYLPLISRMGAKVSAELEFCGFYPAGGGKFRVKIEPAQKLTAIDILERGEITSRKARSLIAQLPYDIGKRQLGVISSAFGWTGDMLAVEQVKNSRGPGNVLVVEIQSRNITEVFTGFGEKGVLAETIAAGTADEVKDYLSAGVPVGKHLADQLLIPMAMAGGGSFRTMSPSRHTMTNIAVLKQFLDVSIEIKQIVNGVCEISFLKNS